MEGLPIELTKDILSRVPLKTIFHCKHVCKKWRNLVLDFDFVDLHLSRSPSCLIIHNEHGIDPKSLKLVEIEDKVDHHHLHRDPLITLDLNSTPILQNSRINSMASVNGLICLCQYLVTPKLHNAYIFNPITRECIILPSPRCYRSMDATIVYGFGVSSLTREYKVLRTFQVFVGSELIEEAEVYTLGTGQWRSLGRVPYSLNGFYGVYGPFLNGHCHWIVSDKEENGLQRLCAFDLDKETFQSFPCPPPEPVQLNPYDSQALTVLKGCLCKTDTYDSQVIIWVMKEYGIKKSWQKEAVITQEIGIDVDWPLWNPVFPIVSLKDGCILIVFEHKLWAFYPQSGTIEDTRMFDYVWSVMAYRPSFLKLENFESERVQMF